jgi:hypothetical protein
VHDSVITITTMGALSHCASFGKGPRKWRNRDVQRVRQRCLLSGNGDAYLYGRHEARRSHPLSEWNVRLGLFVSIATAHARMALR